MLSTGGTPTGYQQLAWWVEDLDASVKAVQEATGWPVVFASRGDDTLRYVYFEPPAGGPAPFVEIMELNPTIEGFAHMLRAASDGWDGTDPIRSLGPA